MKKRLGKERDGMPPAKRRWVDRADGGVELWTKDGPPWRPWRVVIIPAVRLNKLLDEADA